MLSRDREAQRSAEQAARLFGRGLIVPSKHFGVQNFPDGRQRVFLRPEIEARLHRRRRRGWVYGVVIDEEPVIYTPPVPDPVEAAGKIIAGTGRILAEVRWGYPPVGEPGESFEQEWWLLEPVERFIGTYKGEQVALDLGTFPMGTELVFGIKVNEPASFDNPGEHWYKSGEASRNPDELVHAWLFQYSNPRARTLLTDTGSVRATDVANFRFSILYDDPPSPDEISFFNDAKLWIGWVKE